MTYRDRLEQYSKALKSGGFLRIKTDNDDFFSFTVDEIESVLDRCDFVITYSTNDLRKSVWAEKSPMTEYESKFSESGKNINFISLMKK